MLCRDPFQNLIPPNRMKKLAKINQSGKPGGDNKKWLSITYPDFKKVTKPIRFEASRPLIGQS